MADASGIKAGQAFVTLGLRSGDLTDGLNKVVGSVRNFGKSIQSLGQSLSAISAATIGPVMAMGKSFAENAVGILKQSQMLGMTTEAITAMNYAAGKSMVETEALGTGLRMMNRSIGAAAEGSDAARHKFEALGINFANLQAMKPEDQFAAIADAIKALPTPAERTSAAMRMFGRSGASLLPMLEQGGAAIHGLTQEAADLGLTLSAADAQGARQFLRQFNSFGKTISQATFALSNAMMPALVDATKWMSEGAKGIALVLKAGILWVKGNKDTVVSLLKIGGAIGALGAVLVSAGGLVFGLSTAWALLAGVFVAIKFVFAGILSLFATILSPVGLLIAAFIALGVVIARMVDWGAVIQYFGDQWKEMAATFNVAWGGIMAALRGGDLQTAIDIAWAGALAVLTRVWGEIKVGWAELTAWFGDTWDVTVNELAKVLNESWAGWKIAWVTGVNFVKNLWSSMVEGLALMFNDLLGSLQKGWAILQATITGGDSDEAARRADADTAGRAADIQQSGRAERAQNDRVKNAQVSGIVADTERENREMDAELANSPAMRARQQSVRDARGEADAANEAANNRVRGLAGGAQEQEWDDMMTRTAMQDAIARVQQQVAPTLGVGGTFSAAAAGQALSGGGPAEETARNTARIAAGIDELREEVRMGGGFA